MKNSFGFLLAIIITVLYSCSTGDNTRSELRGFTQGTGFSVIFYHDNKIDESLIEEEIKELLLNFDNSLSTYNPESIISRVNNNEEVDLDTLFVNVFNKSYEIWKLTRGAFDITAAPLINAWGFGPDATRRFNESIKDRLMELVGMDKIKIEDGKIIKSDPDMQLDVNAIAQGYSVDVLYNYLDKKGIERFLVEVGGEVRTKGYKPGKEAWVIGLDKPEDGNITPGVNRQADIMLVDKALATSGNYRKFFVEDGVKYSHTIDPSTGYPVRHKLLSATIITTDCMTADALATACMVMGREKAIELISSLENVDAYLVYSDEEGNFRTWFTEGMVEYIYD